MKKSSKRIFVTCMLVAVMVITTLFTGCKKKEDTSNQTNKVEKNETKPTESAKGEVKEEVKEPEQVHLKWVVYAEIKPETERIWEKYNELLKEKLPNTTVEFIAFDSPSYNDKSRLMVTAGEDFDIMWASNWKGDYLEKVKGGAFLPVQELIDNHAPGLWDAIPPQNWNLIYVDGVLYGVPNHQTNLNGKSMDILDTFYQENKAYLNESLILANAYDFSVSPVEALRAYEPIIQRAKELYPNRIPVTDCRDAISKTFESLVNGPEGSVLAGVKKTATDLKVYSVLESQEFRDLCELAAEWQKKGYLPNDIATYKNIPPSQWGSMGPIIRFDNFELEHPQNKANQEKLMGAFFRDHVFNIPYVSGTSGPSTANFISAKSKNPERAIQLLELMNTDAEIYNLLCWGDESLYSYDENGAFVSKSDQYSMRDWTLGNTDNSYAMQNNKDLIEMNAKVMSEAEKSYILGFMFNTENVKNEIAAVSANVGTYMEILVYGLDKNWETTYNDMIKQAKAAGLDKIIEEAQRQLDEWAAIVGK